MYNVEPNETIQRIVKILHQTGVWRLVEASIFRETCRKLFFLLYLIAFQVFNAISAFLTDDKNETIFLTEIGVFYAVITVKQVYLLWKKDKIIAFLNDPISAHSTEHHEVSQYVNRKLNGFMRFVHIYLLMLTITSSFIGTSCLPMFTTEKKLPYFISYSIDWTQSEIMYWFMYGFVSLAIIYGFIFNFVTIFIWYLMFNYSVAYEVVGNQLRNLGVDRRPTATERNLFQLQLIDSVETHRNTFE